MTNRQEEINEAIKKIQEIAKEAKIGFQATNNVTVVDLTPKEDNTAKTAEEESV